MTLKHSVLYKNFLFCLTLVLFLFLQTGSYSQKPEQEYKIVVAEGVAVFSPDKSPDILFDQALLDAKRNSVNIGIGVLVNAETIVENYELLSDRILTSSAGYVREYKVLSSEKQGDLYRVVISAKVAMADLNSDILAVQLLKDEKEYPRIMLLGMEMTGEEQRASLSAQTIMEKILIDRGFDLVDEAQVEIVKARDIALHPDDHKTAAALGERFGAEIIIVFQAIADYEGTSDAYGLSLHSYRGTLDARIIYTDTADLLASVSVSRYAASEGRPAAIRLAFQRLGQKAAPLIIEKILMQWQTHINKLELVVKGLDFKEMTKMKEHLRMIRHVHAVAAPGFDNGVAVFSLRSALSSQRIAEEITKGRPFPNLRIISLSPGRIEAEKKH